VRFRILLSISKVIFPLSDFAKLCFFFVGDYGTAGLLCLHCDRPL
jgi:hypothetical protein